MFLRNKTLLSSITRFPTNLNDTTPFKVISRHVNTAPFQNDSKKKLGYVLVGGGCLILSVYSGHRLKNSFTSWFQRLKFPSVLADVTPRIQYNDIANILENKSLAIVAIDSWLTEENNRKLYDYGVGFVEESSELVITNEAFISFDQDKLFQVIFEDGSVYHAKVVSLDNHSDLAALRLCNDKGEIREKGGVPTIKLHTSPLRLGEKLVAVTMHDKDSDPSVYKVFSGYLTNIKQKEDDSPLQMSTNNTDGAFGGPVLNTDGEVVGVVSVRYHTGAALSIPYNYIKKFIERSLQHEKSILKKEADIRQQLREEKEQEIERKRKEMEEIIEARKQLQSESEKDK